MKITKNKKLFCDLYYSLKICFHITPQNCDSYIIQQITNNFKLKICYYETE